MMTPIDLTPPLTRPHLMTLILKLSSSWIASKRSTPTLSTTRSYAPSPQFFESQPSWLKTGLELSQGYARLLSLHSNYPKPQIKMQKSCEPRSGTVHSLRLYSVWPRWPRNRALQLRLHQFLSGNYKPLTSHWHRDVIKQRNRRRKPSNDTIEARTVRAVSEILDPPPTMV